MSSIKFESEDWNFLPLGSSVMLYVAAFPVPSIILISSPNTGLVGNVRLTDPLDVSMIFLVFEATSALLVFSDHFREMSQLDHLPVFHL